MSRTPVRLKIDGKLLHSLMKGKETFEERATKHGVTKQAVSQWINENLIPPRALAEIVHSCEISPKDIADVLAPGATAEKRKYRITIEMEEI